MKDPFANMDESLKHLVDGVSVIATVGTLIEMLPSIAALFTIVWTGIRIYETNTVQRMLGRKGGEDGES
jgi:FtsH-binding integral membrane protein